MMARSAGVFARPKQAAGERGAAMSETWQESPEHGELQRLVDLLFATETRAHRLDALVLAQSHDLSEDLVEVVSLLPPMGLTRPQFCDQINSTLAAHGWGRRYGIVS